MDTMKVCLGGTFDKLHKGHRMLIDKAFETAGKNGFVFIGLTTASMVREKKNVEKYDFRKKQIESYISQQNFSIKFEIKPIEDKFGPSIAGDFDAIVVSPGTKKTALEINEMRKKKNKKILKIVEIPFILADDDKPISSTRIKNREIDEEGNIP